MGDAPKCAHCGEIIGMYEPVIVVQAGEVHETSRAAELGLTPVARWHYHRQCHEALQAARPPIE
jgi:hypothetical protein